MYMRYIFALVFITDFTETINLPHGWTRALMAIFAAVMLVFLLDEYKK